MSDHPLRRLIGYAAFRWPDLHRGKYQRRLFAAFYGSPYLPEDLTPERRARALAAWAECLEPDTGDWEGWRQVCEWRPEYQTAIVEQLGIDALFGVWLTARLNGDDPLEAIVEWIERRAEDWRRIVGACAPEMAADPGTSPGRQTTGPQTAQEESTE